MNKKVFINELKEGDRLEDVFLVKTSRLAQTRAGKPYLILSLMDKGGDIGAPVWDKAEQMNEICRVGAFVRIQGLVQSYRDNLQLKIDSIVPVDQTEIDLADFAITGLHDIDQMAEQLQRIVQTIKNSHVRKLLKKLLLKGELWDHFQNAPAAKSIHHAYVGGLLEHCLSLARLADFMASHYPGVDRSILLAGALLHDIGKVHELQVELGLVEYTAVGRLKGHLVMGSEMVAETARTISDFPEELLVQVQHLILSHHGRLEFGSPVVPMTVEALLLNYIDEMDSKMNLVEQLSYKLKDEGMQWSDYQRSLERFLYLRPMARPDEVDEEKAENLQGKQQSLF